MLTLVIVRFRKVKCNLENSIRTCVAAGDIIFFSAKLHSNNAFLRVVSNISLLKTFLCFTE